MEKTARAALYLRVSTTKQDTDNQRQSLERVAGERGWKVVAVYEDAGISGSKGRDRRPRLDAMLKDAGRERFDVVMTWAIDRLGRSLTDLLATLKVLDAAKVDLFIHQQALDTTTPSGRLIFQVTGAFAEFERTIIVSRINAGLARARAETPAQRAAKQKKDFGRPRIDPEREALVRAELASGKGILKVARELHVGSGTVQRVRKATASAETLA